jgi:hypothetical protein
VDSVEATGITPHPGPLPRVEDASLTRPAPGGRGTLSPDLAVLDVGVAQHFVHGVAQAQRHSGRSRTARLDAKRLVAGRRTTMILSRAASPKSRRRPGRAYPSLSKRSSMPLSNAASSPTASCACAAPSAPMRNGWLSPVNDAGLAPRAGAYGRDCRPLGRSRHPPSAGASMGTIPIPLRYLFAAHPQLLAPVLPIIHACRAQTSHRRQACAPTRMVSACMPRCAVALISASNLSTYAADHAHAQGAPARMSWARLA